MRFFRRPELYAASRTTRPRLFPGYVCSLLLAGAVTSGKAQDLVSGGLHGVIRDTSGQGIPLTEITAHSLEDGGERTTRALPDGTFLLNALEPGSYTLRVRVGSYETVTGQSIDVVPGKIVEVSGTITGETALHLHFGTAFEEAGPSLEPDENDDGLVSVHGLPPMQVASTVDGISADQALGAVPLGAGREEALDPADDADSAELTTGPGHGLARGRHAGVAYTYSQASIREFRVGAENYSAQVGSAAGVLSSVTRAGSERLHGSGTFHLRSSILAAMNPLAIATSYSNGAVTSQIVKPHDLRENAAWSLGGPIPHFRAVRFFDAFDLQRRGFPAISSPADPDFYNLTAIQRALLATRGVSTAQIDSALNFLAAETGTTPRRSDQEINFARLDWRRGPRLSAGLEYNRVRWRAPGGLIDAPVVARGRASLGNATGGVDQVLLRLSPHLSGRMLVETRLSFTRDLQYETPQTPLPQEAAIGPGGTSPEVNIGPNGLLFGTPASLSQIASPDEQRMEAGALLTLVRGHHLLAVGGSFALVQEKIATLGNAAGTFRYDSGVTRGYAGGLVDFITDQVYSAQSYPNGGCPSIAAADHLFCFRSFSQSFGEQKVAFSTQELAGFAEETWRPHPRLMLHLGARYEYTLLPLPQRPNPALDAVFGVRGATGVFPEDRNNIGPRFSASFEPLGRGRLLVHGGYGLFFGHLPGATIQSALSNTGLPSSTLKIRLRPSTVVACPQELNQGFGYLCSFTAEPTGVAVQTTSSMVFDRQFRLPVVQQASIYLERQITRGTALSVGYVNNQDRQLPSSTDLNIARSTTMGLFQLQGGTGAAGVRDGETFVLPMYTSRVSTNFGPVTDIVSNANATYNGVVARVTSRPVSGLTIAANYTWSRAVDFGESASATPRTNNQLDPFTDGYDKGPSSLNYPHALHATIVFTPQFEGTVHALSLARGWTLAAITTARSGRPYSMDLSGGTYLAGGHESLNGSGGALYLPTIGRNTLRLPPTIKSDLRLGRALSLGRKLKGEATAEAFNAFNHQSITSVNQRAFLVGTPVGGVTPLIFQNAAAIATEGLNTTAFGTPTASGSSLNRERQIQLSLRLVF